MNRRYIFLFMLLAAGIGSFSYAQKNQNRQITGYVTDLYHYPVSGAVVVINNDENTVVTDENGYYKVRVNSIDKEAVISVVSYVHGVIQEPVSGRTRINFSFPSISPNQNTQPDNSEYTPDDEEVNIGYGKRKRSEIVTAVNKLDGTDTKYQSYTNIYQMLQGNVPGVFVNRNQVLVRGVTSFLGSNEPLYIVDGIPVASIADIPPSFVKSIEVLKGAASAIYGSRGANGVILIDLIDAENVNSGNLALPGMVPLASTQPATDIHATGATLNGLINANDISSAVVFEYGTTSAYGNKIPALQNPVTSRSTSKVSVALSDLRTGITYHFRVTATNSYGTTVGTDLTFTLRGDAPAAETGAATNTTPATARLNGFVNAHYLQTEVAFEYGPTTDYGKKVMADESPADRNTHEIVTADISGLETGQTYHYRIVATNEMGTAFGKDTTFKAEYVIGDYLNGGYIFYIDESGEHGLVCAQSDQSQTAIWGDCTPTGAKEKTIGSGNQNTSDIVSGCSAPETAARLCYDLELNGYSDWFLPSVNELYLMYTNLYQKGLGDFQRTYYWSSTQDKFGAWVVSFYYGSKSNHSRSENEIRTRAVRAF
jgi:TonB-dependent SusC/RagA subfamily outer membrane receptor